MLDGSGYSMSSFVHTSDDNLSISEEDTDVSLAHIASFEDTDVSLESDNSYISLDESTENNSDTSVHSDEECHNDERLYDSATHTIFTSYVSIMLFVMKHSLTRDAFSDLLMLIKTHLPAKNNFTTSVYKLKEFLKKNIGFEEPIKHYFCDNCGVKVTQEDICQRPGCVGSKLSMFHDLRLVKQIQDLFKGNEYSNVGDFQEFIDYQKTYKPVRVLELFILWLKSG